MIVHSSLRINGCDFSTELEDLDPEWAIVPPNFYKLYIQNINIEMTM